ncbi:hypothetical protein [Yeosuana sp. AK3]
MKYFSLLVCFLCLFSCKNNDKEDIDCALFDPFIANLFVKLVDSEGNNLIENNTFIANNITILFNGNTFTNVVFTNVPGLENLMALNLIGVDGNNLFEIKLSDKETDTLIMNLTTESKVCGLTFFKLNSVTYNETFQTLENFNGNYMITVVK